MTVPTLTPLSAAEREQLAALQQRAEASTGKTGSTYRALINLSVPRADGQTDLVMAGETLILTDAEAHPFLNRRPAVIQPADESDVPRILPRNLFGALRGIPGPLTQSEGGVTARPDPAGSSGIQVLEQVPEASEPQPDAVDAGPPAQDAVDLPPSRGRRAAAPPRQAPPSALPAAPPAR